MKNFTRDLLILTAASIGLAASIALAGDGDWAIDADTFASGAEMAGGDWGLSGTAGQAVTGDTSGGDWICTAGFMSGEHVPACPADFDNSGAVDFSDLVALLAGWGACPGCPLDLDGDDLVTFNDLVALLAAWGPCT